jgi:hypothetical protein
VTRLALRRLNAAGQQGSHQQTAGRSTSAAGRSHGGSTATGAAATGGLAPAVSPYDSQEPDQDFAYAVRLIKGAAVAYGVPADFGEWDELARTVQE